MPISYKHKIYTTLGTTEKVESDTTAIVTNSSGVPASNYSILGRSIVWNQMVKSPDFSNTIVDTRAYVAFRVQQAASPHESFFGVNLREPGLVSAIFTITASGDCRIKHDGDVKDIDFCYFISVKDHKYYICFNFTSTNSTVVGGVAYNKAQLFDLTQMFGAGNEPSTPSEFCAMFPDDYYPYNAGELKSITGYDRKSMMLKRGLLLNKDTFAGHSTKSNGVDFTYNDGSITVNGTSTGPVLSEYFLFSPSISHTITVKGNTKYLFLSHPSLQNSTYYWVFGGTDDAVFPYDEIFAPGKIVSRDTDKTGLCYFILRVLEGKSVNNEVTTPQFFNLTAIFGLGNEPSTVAEFLSYFPPDQYDYTTGEKIGTAGNLQLQSSLPQRFQLSDRKNYFTNTVSGVTFTDNGDGTMTLNGTATAAIWRALQVGSYFIPIGHKVMLSGTPVANSWRCLLYDGSDANYGADTSGTGVIYTQKYGYSNPYFYVAKDYVCNNLIFKPQLFDLTQMFGAGNEPATPEEFWQRVPEKLYECNPNAYKLVNIPSSKYFPDDMKSAGSARDEIQNNSAIRRVGSVDLGTLNWTYNSTKTAFSTTDLNSKIASPATGADVANFVCEKYSAESYNSGWDGTADKCCGATFAGGSKWVWIRDTSYTDAVTFKAAMSGVMLYYELDTPVSTAISPILQALPTYKGFNSFSAPNSLTQNGPLSVTYYAEGGTNPESGWLTSYKRKLYMGRSIEWNQLIDISNFTTKTIVGSIVVSKKLNGTIHISGTSSGSGGRGSWGITVSLTTNHKYYAYQSYTNLIGPFLSLSGQLSKYFSGEFITCDTSGTYLFDYNVQADIQYDTDIRIMVFDLTQMFGAGNEPATPEEFWSYFDHKLYPYNAGETQPLFKISRKSQWGGVPKHYTVRWDGVHAAMDRLNDAANISTNITNFAHRGRVNANYSNPFDSIYPWSGIRLCNVDLTAYRNLSHGDSIRKCVKAWEGDANFSYNDANGVWRYRPEFWGKSWEDDTYRYFDVADKNVYDSTYVHYPEAIVGRWHGRTATLTIGGEEKGCLIPSVGMPAKSIPMSGLHTRAKNFGATLDSIYSVDADTLLCIVEFATMNTQNAIGNGVSDLYRQSSDLIQEDATNSTTVKVLAAAGSAYCIPGAIFDIGTSNGGTQVGSFVVVSATPNVGDAQYLDVTLDQAVTVTGANYWSVHGLANVADEGIGSKSGYIGTNGKCNAYYRGIMMFGNMWFYILGAYENKDDHHIWIANSDAEADDYDALDTTVHYDTGLVLPTARGYTKKLGLLSRSGLLSIPAFCVETGGDGGNLIGDYFYNGVYTYNTVLLRGGNASSGSTAGAFCGIWTNAASYGYWGCTARPRLKNP